MLKVSRVPPLPEASLVGAEAHFWLPRPALSSCIRIVVTRDTRGVALHHEQRYNHFPATPLCSLCWYFHGSGELLDQGSAPQEGSPRAPVAPVALWGPFNRPFISWNPGTMHLMILSFLPDAWRLLTGSDPSAYFNRVVAVDEILDASWLAMCKTVETAADDDCRVRIIDEFLHPLWQQARPDASSLNHIYSDWTHHLALRASFSGYGRSIRQIERRIKRWTGQPLRELRGFGRLEQAYFDALVAEKADSLNWGEVANSAGFTDQSHFTRQTRRLTGYPPAELYRLITEDETFWFYRLLGFTDRRLRE